MRIGKTSRIIAVSVERGKTTLLHAMAHRLNKEGNYVSVVCSMESAGYTSISVETANEVFIQSLYLTSKVFFIAGCFTA